MLFSFGASHYDFGFMQGELLKDSPILPNRKKMWGSKSKLRHFIADGNGSKKDDSSFCSWHLG